MTQIDDETCDLAIGVGETATLAAAVRAAATKRGLIHDPFAEPLVRAVGVDFFAQLAAGEPDVSDHDDAGFARMTDLFAVRTRFFDGVYADAGIAGIQQAVILASGLDARPYRLWWPAGTTVFEIDQPQVVEFKTQTMRRLGVTPTANRRAVGTDLRQDWPAALQRVGFDTTRASAWIAEGLLIGLLPPDAQDRLLDNITALSAAGSRFAADYGGSEYADVADYLAARGWDTAGTTLADLVAATGLAGLRRNDLADGAASTRYLTAVRT